MKDHMDVCTDEDCQRLEPVVGEMRLAVQSLLRGIASAQSSLSDIINGDSDIHDFINIEAGSIEDDVAEIGRLYRKWRRIAP